MCENNPSLSSSSDLNGSKLKIRISSSTSTSSNTPTPTRLLQAVDEAGVFRDLAESPFDEDFRRAASLSDNDESGTGGKSGSSKEDSLNTPQILSADIVVPSSVNPSTKSANVRPILPSKSTNAAQLILKLPTGPSLVLSDLPFIKQDESQVPLKLSAKPPSLPSSSNNDIKERNRYSAARSRRKKKMLMERERAKYAQIEKANALLREENQTLKNRITELESLLTKDLRPMTVIQTVPVVPRVDILEQAASIIKK